MVVLILPFSSARADCPDPSGAWTVVDTHTLDHTVDCTTVVVTAGATLVIAGDGSGPVTITAQDVTIEAGALVSADGTGFPEGEGPGANATGYGGAGAGHGGAGGDATTYHGPPGGPAYGDALTPIAWGSGGAGADAPGGAGGGQVAFNVAGVLVLDGLVTANGVAGGDAGWNRRGGGGGSGGSVWIRAGTLAGDGLITADGGKGGLGGWNTGGGGGAGGRVAVYYDTSTFTGTTATSLAGGGPGPYASPGARGTAAFVDRDDAALTIVEAFDLVDPSAPVYTSVSLASDVELRGAGVFDIGALIAEPEQVVRSGGGLATLELVGGNAPATGAELVLRVAGELSADDLTFEGFTAVTFTEDTPASALMAGLTVTTADTLVLANPALEQLDAVTLTAGELVLDVTEGNLTLVDSHLVLAPERWLSLPCSGLTLLGSEIDANLDADLLDLFVDPTSALTADGRGFVAETGPGAGTGGTGGSGGGYGGAGGDGSTYGTSIGGPVYGDALAPTELGSGGGNATGAGGAGGGVLDLRVAGTLTLDGIISANGADGGDAGWNRCGGGGGSGGGVTVHAASFVGDGSLAADGGEGGLGSWNCGGGGGGGGRVAVYFDTTDFTGAAETSVVGGGHGPYASPGLPGTVAFVDRDDDVLTVVGDFDFGAAVYAFGTIVLDHVVARATAPSVLLAADRLIIVGATVAAPDTALAFEATDYKCQDSSVTAASLDISVACARYEAGASYVPAPTYQQPLGECDPDIDADGLLYDDELAHGADPFDPDTDGDGLSDGEEVFVYGTEPGSADTDWDGVPDDEEILAGTDPLDADGDGIPTLIEVTLGLDPFDPDTDGDGADDAHDGCGYLPGATGDSDGDGVGDACDSCPDVVNGDQVDADEGRVAGAQLSHMPFSYAVSGWGTVMVDRHVEGRCGVDASGCNMWTPAEPIVIGGRTYLHGVGLHASGEVRWAIDGSRYSRLRGAIGKNPSCGGGYQATLYTAEDGVTWVKRWTRFLGPNQTVVEPFDVPIRGVDGVRFVFTAAGSTCGEWVNILEPVLTGDGRGDACDVCPSAFDHAFDPGRCADADGDGVVDAFDALVGPVDPSALEVTPADEALGLPDWSASYAWGTDDWDGNTPWVAARVGLGTQMSHPGFTSNRPCQLSGHCPAMCGADCADMPPIGGGPMALDGVAYTSGWGVHGDADLVWTSGLDGGYVAFAGVIGIDDESPEAAWSYADQWGTVLYRYETDDAVRATLLVDVTGENVWRPVWDSGEIVKGAPRSFDIDVSGAVGVWLHLEGRAWVDVVDPVLRALPPCFDADGDGLTGTPAGCGPDCDNTEAACGADCDSLAWADGDGDGLGDPAVSHRACDAPDGYVAEPGDCDDDAPFCGVDCGVDEDGDGIPDCRDLCLDADGDGYGAATVAGDECLGRDCDDAVASCAVDCTAVLWRDGDGDGYGDLAVSHRACDAPAGFVPDASDCDDSTAACSGDCVSVLWRDGDADGHGDVTMPHRACDAPAGYVADSGDCDDAVASCTTDCASVAWRDGDGDGFGDVAVTHRACDAPSGFVVNDGDCDDAVASCASDCASVAWRDGDGDGYGDAAMVHRACDAPSGYVANDRDCDDAVASCVDDCTSQVWMDSDGDGYGDAAVPHRSCDAPSGYVGDDGDCDDAVASCVDDCTSLVWMDGDGDGYGNAAVAHRACDAPAGYVADSDDCDDTRQLVNPSAVERCDGLDDDCDGVVDDGYDEDGDGVTSCGGDCDDGAGWVFPGAVELCNAADDDCDGLRDEDGACGDACVDLDHDGFGVEPLASCKRPGADCDDGDARVSPRQSERCDTPYDDDCDGVANDGCDGDGDGVSPPADCNDADASVLPGGVEVCNGVDDDCDGFVDGGLDCGPDEDGDGVPDGFDVCPGDTWNACDPDVAQQLVTVDEGGLLAPTSGELALDLPPGALAQDTVVTAERSELDPAIALQTKGGGKAGPVLSYAFTPEGQSFVAPVLLTLYWEDADDVGRVDDGGQREDKLDIYWLNPATGTWEPQSASCDLAANYCSVWLDHFSTYALAEALDTDGDGAFAGDCDDDDPSVHPAALELCDGADDDCDGVVDEGYIAVTATLQCVGRGCSFKKLPASGVVVRAYPCDQGACGALGELPATPPADLCQTDGDGTCVLEVPPGPGVYQVFVGEPGDDFQGRPVAHVMCGRTAELHRVAHVRAH